MHIMINTQALVIDKAKTYVIRAHVYMNEYRMYWHARIWRNLMTHWILDNYSLSCATCTSIK